MTVHVAHPFRIDGRGRVAEVDDAVYVEQLIEQVLFTSPGERVNRPTFGSGLQQLVFAPNSDELHTAVEYLVQGALQQWLGDVVQVENLAVAHDDATLVVTIQYVVLRSGEQRTAELRRSAPA